MGTLLLDRVPATDMGRKGSKELGVIRCLALVLMAFLGFEFAAGVPLPAPVEVDFPAYKAAKKRVGQSDAAYGIAEANRYAKEVLRDPSFVEMAKQTIDERMEEPGVAEQFGVRPMADLYEVRVGSGCFESKQLSDEYERGLLREQVQEAIRFLMDLYVANLGQRSIFFPVRKLHICQIRDNDKMRESRTFFYDPDSGEVYINVGVSWHNNVEVEDRDSIARKWKLGKHYDVLAAFYLDEIDDGESERKKADKLMLGKYLIAMKLTWMTMNPIGPLKRIIQKLVRKKRVKTVKGWEQVLIDNQGASSSDFMAELLVDGDNRRLFQESDSTKFWNLTPEQMGVAGRRFVQELHSPGLFLGMIADAVSNVGCQTADAIKTDINVESEGTLVSVANAHNIRVSLCSGGDMQQYFDDPDTDEVEQQIREQMEDITVKSKGFVSVATVDNIHINANLNLNWASPDAIYVAAMKRALDRTVRPIDQIRSASGIEEDD